jgi:4'-phosphopantetheinyl transferase
MDQKPSAVAALNAGEVHVWCARPEEIGSEADARRCLAADELERSARYRLERPRQLAIASRVLLRTVLSRYEPVAPADWRFAVEAHGRPIIADGRSSLRFSVSKAAGLVVCAVAAGDLGVDVESLSRAAPLEVADRFFAPAEVAALRALPERERAGRFFAYWTFKESYVKARGLGLSLPLDKFVIVLGDGSPRIAIDPSLGDAGASWQLTQLRPTKEHIVSLCVRRRGERDRKIALLWNSSSASPTEARV